MLPFNGDETYIAGGLLPRFCMDDGSSESTFLYLESSKRLLSYLKENAPELDTEQYGRAYRAALEAYKANFYRDGRLAANNPARRKNLVYAEKRIGVCEACGRFTDLCSAGGYYVCADCAGKARPEKRGEIYYINAVPLTMLYLRTDILRPEELRRQISEVEKRLESGAGKVVGYEYGMLLNAKLLYGDENARHWLDKLLALVDDSGVYSEYYVDSKPRNCSYRPWESAINAEAVYRFAMKNETIQKKGERL
jgi:hypothetical protein